jgi:hypothetical protein
MLIFENPGSPSGRNLAVENNPEMAYDISDAKLPEVLRLCIKGQKNWLFEHQGADEELWEEFGFRIGETIYTTDSHKCPNPKEKEKSTPTQKERTRALCLDYLREEIRIVRPKAIIAFGEPSRKSLADIEGVAWEGKVTGLPQDARLKVQNGRCYALLPHPGWYNKYGEKGRLRFNDDLRFVFGKVSGFIKRAMTSA